MLASAELRDSLPDPFRRAPRRFALAVALRPGVQGLELPQLLDQCAFEGLVDQGAFDNHGRHPTGLSTSPRPFPASSRTTGGAIGCHTCPSASSAFFDAARERVTIHVTEDIATAIAKALSETHRKTQRAKEEAAGVFRAQLAALDGRDDRLFKMLDAGTIDAETYQRQKERLRHERDDLFEKLREADRSADDGYLVTANRVLELAKSAKKLWETRSPQERRDFLEKLLWNPTLDGRTVRYDLRKPFDVLAKMGQNEEWRPQRESNPRYRRERPMS